jgi:hypothetical protein
MPAKETQILALFDAIAPTTLDQDLSAELKTDDWKTEANVLAALRELGHTRRTSGDLRRPRPAAAEAQQFQPDVIFNLADQFKNNRAFDQNIVSFLEMQRHPRSPAAARPASRSASTRASRRRSSATTASTSPDFMIIAARQTHRPPARSCGFRSWSSR